METEILKDIYSKKNKNISVFTGSAKLFEALSF